MKRPSRGVFKNESCPGNADGPCVFNLTQCGCAARINPDRKKPGRQTHCLVCSPAEYKLQQEIRNGQQITSSLKKLFALSKNIYKEGLRRIGREHGPEEAAARKKRVEQQVMQAQLAAKSKAEKGRPLKERWHDLLSHRVRTAGGLSAKEKKAYAEIKRRDRATVRRKVFLPDKKFKKITEKSEAAEEDALRQKGILSADIADNDSGLPAPACSERARHVESWCKHGSWQLCERCHSVLPRPLQPMDTRQTANATRKHCGHCAKGSYVPQPEHVPAANYAGQEEVRKP